MLCSYTESKHKHAFSPFHKIQTPCIQDLSPLSIQVWKRDMGYMLWKKRELKKELEKMVKKKCRAKKRGLASKIAHDLKHLDLERESLKSQLSTHIHTLALLIMFVCCFLHGSMLWVYNINILCMPFTFSYLKLHTSCSCRTWRQ